MYPAKLRFFLVGEYGDFSQRPHYHAALFGLGRDQEEIVQKAWPFGFIYLGDLTKDSASYIAGYVTKKMTKKHDPRLKGRYPEFARMSLRPGIGADAMLNVANALTTEQGCEEILRTGDVPLALQHGLKKFPLGRYLRRKLREALGFPDPSGREAALKALALQVQELHAEARQHKKGQTFGYRHQALTKQQKIINLETRHKIYNKKGDL